MNKLIIGSFLAIGLLLGCKKKDKEPLEYFSFTANGVKYYYSQEKRSGFLGVNQALWAGASTGNLGYFIGASNFEDLAIPGTFRFTFSPVDQLPQQDTIILDGVNNSTVIEWFLNQDAYYKLLPPQTGKIIFTERSEERVTGIFEFEATRTVNPISGTADSVLYITNGKFSIIPSS